jgi:hypothetical protein
MARLVARENLMYAMLYCEVKALLNGVRRGLELVVGHRMCSSFVLMAACMAAGKAQETSAARHPRLGRAPIGANHSLTRPWWPEMHQLEGSYLLTFAKIPP